MALSLHRSRKGVFFTLIALLISGLILFSLILDNGLRYSEKSEVLNIRLETMNDFMTDLEHDMERALYITGFRTLLSLQQYVASNGEYLDDVTPMFEEALFNGTINGSAVQLMENSTFTLWVERIQEEASLIDISLDIELYDMQVSQQDPWSVNVLLETTLNITDVADIARWDKNHLINSSISIIGLEDPFYIISSTGLVSNVILPTNITDFVVEATNNTDGLKIHLNNSYYIASSRAPNYLMRLEGNFSNSTNGIESLVNLNKFIVQGFGTDDRSAVDYLYFSDIVHNTHRVSQFSDTTEYSWFRLDDVGLTIYECDGLALD